MQFQTLYFWGNHSLRVDGEAKSTSVAISEELKERIRVFTGGDEVLGKMHWW